MTKSPIALAAALSAVGLAAPGYAITFPSLTTIYIGSGVRDDGGSINVGTATTFHCSNVSGVAAQIRFLVLSSSGAVAGNATLTAAHGQTLTVSTHATVAYFEHANLNTGGVAEGMINIESRQSGVFCTAKTIDASLASPVASPSTSCASTRIPER